MTFYLIELVDDGGKTRLNRVSRALVEADTVTMAREMVEAARETDGPWTIGAHATALTLTAGQVADMRGWRYRVRLYPPVGTPTQHQPKVDVEYTGVPADTVDLIGAALATRLNQTQPINGASYDGPSNTLIISNAADNLGDHKALVEAFPPGVSTPVKTMVEGVADGGSPSGSIEALLAVPANVPSVIRLI